MTVLVPAINEEGVMLDNKPLTHQTTLLERYKIGNTSTVVVLQNKLPEWDESRKEYTLDFHGRVKLPSVKNFQLVEPSARMITLYCFQLTCFAAENVLLQFGRVSELTFSLDFQYPFTPIQALGIVLSSFDMKIGVE